MEEQAFSESRHGRAACDGNGQPLAMDVNWHANESAWKDHDALERCFRRYISEPLVVPTKAQRQAGQNFEENICFS